MRTLKITRLEPHGMTEETIILAPGAIMTVEGAEGGPRHTIEFSLNDVKRLDFVEVADEAAPTQHQKVNV